MVTYRKEEAQMPEVDDSWWESVLAEEERYIAPPKQAKVAETVKKLTGNLKIEYKEARPVDYIGKIKHDDEAQKELGWKPKIDFEEGIKRYIDWYKTN